MHLDADSNSGAPVLEALDDLRQALGSSGAAVLVAPPGTGKTTELPPALAARTADDTGRSRQADSRIVVVVPRRMAARAAAARMAHRHGGRVGQRFGYSVRHDSKVGSRTRVEVVTAGILLRRLQNDPGLEGTATVVLDEFHERSVDADLLLALLIDARSGLRPDLELLVMSATLDAAPVAELLDGAAVLEVDSPLHPIRTHYHPGSAHDRFEERVGDVVAEALGANDGDVLVFLPGRGEIRAVARLLGRRQSAGVDVRELHGSVSPEMVAEILDPAQASRRARRVILSTSIAETSITVPGVRVVVDAGLRRSAEVDQRSGLPGLVTRAVSAAGADQRRGRCGREAPGSCYRMWAEREEETRRASDPAEITVADLSPMLLAVLDWGAQPHELRWLDDPPATSLANAADLLADLGAVTRRPSEAVTPRPSEAVTPRPSGAVAGDLRLTRFGRELAQLGFHPRIGAIAANAAANDQVQLAAEIATVLEAEGSGHLEVAEGVRAIRRGDADTQLRRSLQQWLRQLGGDRNAHRDRDPGEDIDRAVGSLLLTGYAVRLARRRDPRRDGREERNAVYHLRSGGEIEVRSGGDMGEWIVAVSVDSRAGSAKPGVAHLVAAVHPEDVAGLVAASEADGELSEETSVSWDPGTGAVHTTTERRLGAVLVDTHRRSGAEPDALAEVVAQSLATGGAQLLPGFEATASLRDRIAFAAATGLKAPSQHFGWPDLSAPGLAEDPRWLADALVAVAGERPAGRRTAGRRTAGHRTASTGDSGGLIRLRTDPDRLDQVLRSRLTYQDLSLLDREVPTHWRPPGSRPLRVEYGSLDGDPASVILRVRLQELLGVDVHPEIGRRAIPVTVELLSPAGRPLQRTMDLPGFWRGSYAQVRAEMRGRYPKHPWPARPWEPTGSR